MSWFYLIAAGLFEVVGVLGMNRVAQGQKTSGYIVLVLGFAASFSLLALAMETLPLGMSYAIWTGIGTVGGTLVGMFVYGESRDWKRIFFIAVIICSVVGLKLFA
ncbi:MAG: multidrug efflux SMR transporter [Caryophanon sp.]|nr:multidrug efflux SMR transporter [Caryophanon sp.]